MNRSGPSDQAGHPVSPSPASGAPTATHLHLSRLTREEEAALFTLVAAGQSAAAELKLSAPDAAQRASLERQVAAGAAARHTIFEGMRRLAESQARQVARYFAAPEEDLTQQALLKLDQLIDRFDPARGARFSTYVYRSLRRDLYSATNLTGVRFTGADLRLAHEMRRHEERGVTTDLELAFHLGVTPADIQRIRLIRSYEIVSLEASGIELTVPPSDDLVDLRLMVETLPAPLQHIVRMRFGLPPYYDVHRLGEIAEATGCTVVIVKRLLRQATLTLRAQLSAA
jgi:RNA polymerase sigma factor (sigma-70 family)